MAKSRRKTRGRRGGKASSALVKKIKSLAKAEDFKRLSLKWLNIDGSGPTTVANIPPTQAAFQAIFQDVPLALSTPNPDQMGRYGAVIYPQQLAISALLRGTDPLFDGIQSFRVVVVRYIGEMDFAVVNATNNGWHVQTQYSHMVRPGEVWEQKPYSTFWVLYVRNQIQVLYDHEYKLNKEGAQSLRMNFKVALRHRKMTFESNLSGNTAVGAGNIFIGISSDSDFDLYNYRTVGLYKQFS